MKKLLLTAGAVGSLLLTLTSCSASGGSVLGTWGDETLQGSPALTFEKDGSVSGTDGCNRIFGSYESKGKEVSFGQLASTMMYCEGVDEWLGEAATAKVDGQELHVFDASGNEIGVLAKNTDAVAETVEEPETAEEETG